VLAISYNVRKRMDLAIDSSNINAGSMVPDVLLAAAGLATPRSQSRAPGSAARPAAPTTSIHEQRPLAPSR